MTLEFAQSDWRLSAGLSQMPKADAARGGRSPINWFWMSQACLLIVGLAVGTGAGQFVAAKTGAGPTSVNIEEMTYNGMTLADFSIQMDLPINHPYLVALFEQLCMSEPI